MIKYNSFQSPLSQLSRTGSVDLDPHFPRYISSLPKNLKNIILNTLINNLDVQFLN